MDCIIVLLVISIIIILLIDKSMECFKAKAKAKAKPIARITIAVAPIVDMSMDVPLIPELQNILNTSTPLNTKYQEIGRKLNNKDNKKMINDKLENITLQEHYNIIKTISDVSKSSTLPSSSLPQPSLLPINPSSVDLKTLQMNANANKTVLSELMLSIFDINMSLDTKIKTINTQTDLLQSNLKQIQNNMPDTNINKQTIGNNLTYLVNIKILPTMAVKDYQVVINKIRGINISV